MSTFAAKTAGKPRVSVVYVEDAQMSSFGEPLRQDRSERFANVFFLSTFDRSEGFCGLQPSPVRKMLKSPGVGSPAAPGTFGRAGAPT